MTFVNNLIFEEFKSHVCMLNRNLYGQSDKAETVPVLKCAGTAMKTGLIQGLTRIDKTYNKNK